MSLRTRTPLLGGLVAAAVATVALSGCMPALGKVALRQGAVAPQVWDNSDPGVLVDGSKTYLFGSSNNVWVPVREITDFNGSLATSRTAWGRHPVDAMPNLPPWIGPDRVAIWAPSPVKIGATYFLYFAARRAGATDILNDQCIGRATSRAPMGPYTSEATPLYCGLPPEAGSNAWGRGALDPEVFRAPDGKLYLLAAFSRTRNNIGVVALTPAGLPVGGLNAKPSVLASQKYPWHDGSDNTTLDPTFLENPSMAYDPTTKTYLLFYSAGNWWTDRYLTGFGRCATPTGPCVLDGRGPFLKAGAGRGGVGGLTAFRDSSGVLRVAYASWVAGREGLPSADGAYSRQTSWSRLMVSSTTKTSDQSVWLQP